MADRSDAPLAGDHNLLFGILALQMDFIDPDGLIAAMQTWVFDKSKPLGRILVEQGQLTQERLQLLTALVAEHLKAHHNDPQQSLAALPSASSVRHDLGRIQDDELHASLANVGSASPPDPEATTTYADRPDDGLRYRILRPHAKGGLGEVYVAEDLELHREVALKEIQERHAKDANSRGRFLQEAEITGRLEHPGIVPVYGLGQYGDGRPFYAMRFIKGDNLKEAIRRFHETDLPGRNPSERSLALRQLLGRFIDVCDAVAYAHSRGVLHRDLKPGNIMLGKYGETLIVDWGLAKAVGTGQWREDSEEEKEATLLPSSGSGVAVTQMGSTIGTPAYMSPEQAAGKLDQLGPASDVYSMGATLYCLLTGQAPYKENEAGDVLRQVQRGELRPPRQLKPSVPPALEAVCLKAMARQPEDRYPSARALANDIEHWLADEPVTAWPEPLHARAGRWARRHKPQVAVLATVLLLGIVAIGWRLWHLDVTARAVSQDLQVAETALQALDEGRDDAGTLPAARHALELARARLAGGGSARLRERLERLQQDLDLIVALEQASLQMAAVSAEQGALPHKGWNYVGSDRRYAAAFDAYGLDVTGSRPEEAAERIRASARRTQLVVALDHWAQVKARLQQESEAPLRALAALADEDAWRRRLREAVGGAKRKVLVAMAEEKQSADQPTASLEVLIRVLEAFRDPDSLAAAERLLRRAQQRRPADFWLNYWLALILSRKGAPNHDEIVGFFRVALALRPDSAWVHNELGLHLRKLGDPEGGIAYFRKALELDSKFARAHFNLGVALMAKGDLDEAIEHYRKAVNFDPQWVPAHINLGPALHAKGDLEGAIGQLRKALELEPKSALAHNNLGNALKAKGDLEGAIRHYRLALELDPKYAIAHSNLGLALKDKGNLDEAIVHHQKAIGLDPKFANAHIGLGTALADKKDLEGAIRHYRMALELDPKLAMAHYNLGVALKANGDLEGAIRHYRLAINHNPKHASTHNNLGVALKANGDLEGAIRHYRLAIEHNPKNAGAHNNLGNALRAKGDIEEAIRHYRAAAELEPRNSMRQLTLGNALSAKDDVEGAIRCYRAAIEVDPKQALAHSDLGFALYAKQDLVGAIRHFRTALELDPKLAKAHGGLGQALWVRGEFAEARTATQNALRLLPPNDPFRPTVSQLLRQCETMLALDQKLPAVLRGAAKPQDPAEAAALAQLCQIKKRFAAAARLYADAFAAEPKLAEALTTHDRTNAACAAACAGSGQGKDAAKLDDRERARLRQQALTWLRADLAAYDKRLAVGKAEDRTVVQQQMQQWQQDNDFAGVRDDALAKLTEAERKEWQKLWEEVELLRKRTTKDTKSPEK
jgi:tetratricopeptide (TPR) repeat protein/tRNA A-37 threonylcarbamoyl transferase component Bud32